MGPAEGISRRGFGRGMRLWRAVGRGLAVVAGTIVLCVAGLARAADDVEATVAALEAAVEEWRQSLEFFCHYTYRQGVAASKTDALEGRFGSRVGRPRDEDTATGVFCKRGSQVRCSVDFGQRPKRVPSKRPKDVLVTTVSCDEVSSGELCLSYWLPHGVVGSASIFRRPDAEMGRLSSGGAMGQVLTSFEFGGGVEGKPLGGFSARPGSQETLRRRIVKLPADRVRVVLERQSARGFRHLRQVTFWTGPRLPVIEKVEELIEDPPLGVRREHVGQASDFVPCGGGLLARRVREASGPVVPQGEKTAVWVAREWVAEDLGQRAPRDEDFVVRVPATVPIAGLKNPPPPGTERAIDLTRYTLADLQPPGVVLPLPEGRPVPGEQGVFRVAIRIALVLGGAAVLVAFLVLGAARRGRNISAKTRGR